MMHCIECDVCNATYSYMGPIKNNLSCVNVNWRCVCVFYAYAFLFALGALIVADSLLKSAPIIMPKYIYKFVHAN